MSEELLNIKF